MLTNDLTTKLDRIILHNDLLSLVDSLTVERTIIGPVARGERFLYSKIHHASDLDLSFNYCTYSARNVLFPPTETLFTFDRENGKFVAHTVMDKSPTAIIGVHPCDIHAIRLLDRIFETDHLDCHYLTRRQSTFIVGMDCAEPCAQNAFCVDMHANAADEGFDVMLYSVTAESSEERRYGVVFGTDAGREWILSGRTGSPTKDDDCRIRQYSRNKSVAFSPHLKTRSEDLPALMKQSYDSLLWDAQAMHCYSCGSCNLVCPTCYCFNIADELHLDAQSGERSREWDSCMLQDFASVAGGHNFRSKTAQRLRHRIFRKTSWIRERIGLTGCVGCGRCDRACTAKISILEMLNQLAEEKTNAS